MTALNAGLGFAFTSNKSGLPWTRQEFASLAPPESDHTRPTFPKRRCRLLHNVLRGRHVRHQRRYVTKNLPFAAQEQRKESLLRGVLVFGMARWVWCHALCYKNTSGHA